MVCPELPPELWQEIARHLSPLTLQQVREVNRPLFHSAMDARYHNVKLTKVKNHTTHVLDALQRPEVARRVRHFTLSSIPLSSMDETCKADNGVAVTRRSQNRRKLKDIIPLLVNVTKFSLLCDDFPSPYIDLVWVHHAQRLTTLELGVPYSKIQSLLPISSSLTNIKNLRLEVLWEASLSIANPSDDLTLQRNVETQLVLSSFVNSLKETLEKLSLVVEQLQDSSTFYDHLGDFPHLTSVELNVTLYSMSNINPPIRSTAFLHKRVGNSLRRLTLSTSRPISRKYQFTFYNLILQNLTYLSISAEVLVMSWEYTLTFLSQHMSTLDTLVIDGPISSPELSLLLTAVNHKNSDCSISTLSLSMHRIDVDLLATIAKDLHRLKSLDLKIENIGSSRAYSIKPGQFFPDKTTSTEEYPFVSAMRTSQAFSNWNLKDLTLRRKSCCGEIILWGLLRLFAECIPTIESFNGQNNMFIPNPPNELPDPKTHARYAPTRLECSYGEDGVDSWARF